MPDFVQSADGTSIAYDVAGSGFALVITGGAFNTLPYSVDRETEDLEAAIRGAAMSRIAVYEPPYVPGNIAARAGVQTALDAGDAGLAALSFVKGTGAENTDGLTQSPWWPSMVAIAGTLPYDLALSGDGVIPTDRLAGIHVPVLVMDGGTSPPWAANAGTAIESAVADGRRVTVAGQGHNVSPGSLAQILIEFLESSS
jgi:hypothetical protein